MSIVRQYPYIDENGNEDYTRIKFYSDEGKNIRKKDYPLPYAIENYPSRFDYEEIDDCEITIQKSTVI